MVVAAVVGGCQLPLAVIGAAELASPEHQRVIEHPALSQVSDQGRAGLVGLAALLADAAGQAAVMVPTGVIELDKSNVALGQPAGQQAVGREAARCPRVGPVELEDMIGLVRQDASPRAPTFACDRPSHTGRSAPGSPGRATCRTRFGAVRAAGRASCGARPRETPGGFSRYRTGSAPARNCTPWCTDGKNPLPQSRE